MHACRSTLEDPTYAAIDAIAPAGGFGFVATAGGKRWTMGETTPPQGGLAFQAGGAMPAGTRLRLLKDGKVIAEAEGALRAPAAGSGVYRVEAYVPGFAAPWILSNPIYVFDADTAARRVQAGAWPAPPPAPPPLETLDAFEGASTFAAEFDSASSIESPVAVPAAGPDGSGAARLAFRLGEPTAGHPVTTCALVSRQPRNLQGKTGLVFWIRGDGVYRLWVQVRDANPASADDGAEAWFASVRTSTEWTRVTLPFERLRSIDKKTDGHLDLDKTRQIVFVLDGGAVAPGTKGTIWLDDVGVY